MKSVILKIYISDIDGILPGSIYHNLVGNDNIEIKCNFELASINYLVCKNI